MNRAIAALLLSACTTSFALAACSEQTQSDAELAAERAAADTAANAEVVGNELREGAIVAADEISDGAAQLSDDLAAQDAADANDGDGELDGTD